MNPLPSNPIAPLRCSPSDSQLATKDEFQVQEKATDELDKKIKRIVIHAN